MDNGQQPAPRAQLLISLHANGSVQVQGATNDKILAYGLLECARDALQDYFEKLQRSAIVPVKIDPFLNHKGG